MTLYHYRAARPDGVLVIGTLEAATTLAANDAVTELGLFPVALAAGASDEGRRAAASRRELAVVFRSLAALVSAGVPLERAVGSSERVARGRLRETLGCARLRLREGDGFAQALASGRGIVPPVVLGMIRAGERGSQLGPTLEQVATHLEQEADFLTRLRQALAYPLLVAVVGLVSVLVIGTIIVPRFADLLGEFGEDLPLTTQILITSSRVLAELWFVLVPLALFVLWGSLEALKRPTVRRRVEEALLSVPVLGAVRLALATARVGRALGSMLRTGMPLLAALEAAGDAAGDAAIAERLRRARERVARGEPLAPSLEREGAILPTASELVAVGEASGRLAEMVLRAGDVAAQDAERNLKTIITLTEPALILVFGGLVAFVAAALLQAVYSLRPGGF